MSSAITGITGIDSQWSSTRADAGLVPPSQTQSSSNAAGLTISTRVAEQVPGSLSQASLTNDCLSLAQSAEGSLPAAAGILDSVRQIAMQIVSFTTPSNSYLTLQQQVFELQSELSRIADALQSNSAPTSASAGQSGSNATQPAASRIDGSSAAYTLTTQSSATWTAIPHSTPTDDDVPPQTLTIASNGQSTNISVTPGETARDLAASVNDVASGTGVSATAVTGALLDHLQAAGTVSFNLNGTNISANVASTSDLSALGAAINAQSVATGVTAVVKGGAIQLTAADGSDIGIGNYTNSAGAAGTLNITSTNPFEGNTPVDYTDTLVSGGTDNASTVNGTVQFSSGSAFTVATNVTGNSLIDGTSQSATLSKASVPDTTATQGSGEAAGFGSNDAALNIINNLNTALDAIRSHLASTQSNQADTSPIIAASSNHIRGTYHAALAADLMRHQILKQTADAMLTQANSLPNGVLKLLEGI
jgi:flagellin